MRRLQIFICFGDRLTFTQSLSHTVFFSLCIAVPIPSHKPSVCLQHETYKKFPFLSLLSLILSSTIARSTHCFYDATVTKESSSTLSYPLAEIRSFSSPLSSSNLSQRAMLVSLTRRAYNSSILQRPLLSVRTQV